MTRGSSRHLGLGRVLGLVIAVLFHYPNSLLAQQATARPTRFPSGITVKTGVGHYSVRDEYISTAKYSGTLPFVSASWARLRETGGYRIEIEQRNSAEIRNGSVSSTVTQFSLSLDYLYRVAAPSLFAKDAPIFLGPSVEFYFYGNEQNIASNGLDLVISFAALVSAGVNAGVVVPLGDRIHTTLSARSTVLSLGLRMVDLMEDDESPFKFLTLPSGANASASLGLRYYLLDRLSLEVAYESQLLRIRPWDRLLAASDNLTLGITLGV